MKLILASQGFTTPEIADAIPKIVGKPLDQVNVAIINEAYVGIAPAEDEKWLIWELGLIKQYIGGIISFVNLRAYDIDEIKRRLEFADLIYIVGGQSGILPKLFLETGFDKLLRELAGTKVIMGTSAGSMVLGQQIQNAEYWRHLYGDPDKYMNPPMLGFVDFNIRPHFGRPDHAEKNQPDALMQLLKNERFPIYGLRDDQAVIYDNDKIEFVGGEPLHFGAGK